MKVRQVLASHCVLEMSIFSHSGRCARAAVGHVRRSLATAQLRPHQSALNPFDLFFFFFFLTPTAADNSVANQVLVPPLSPDLIFME